MINAYVPHMAYFASLKKNCCDLYASKFIRSVKWRKDVAVTLRTSWLFMAPIKDDKN